ncbi:MAG: hypothetical protein II279_06280, partial [Bacteroidaceae bacterium]|nr:hypothetical protein [Bacteroidaceae bacterium]
EFFFVIDNFFLIPMIETSGIVCLSVNGGTVFQGIQIGGKCIQEITEAVKPGAFAKESNRTFSDLLNTVIRQCIN